MYYTVIASARHAPSLGCDVFLLLVPWIGVAAAMSDQLLDELSKVGVRLVRLNWVVQINGLLEPVFELAPQTFLEIRK